MNNEFLGSGGPQGPDMKRLLLSVFLMTGILMVYNSYFGPKVPTDTKEKIAKVESAKTLPKEQKAHNQLVSRASGVKPTSNKLPVQILEFDMQLSLNEEASKASQIAARRGYKAFVSNEGAQIENFILTGYKAPIEIGTTHKGVHLFSIASRDARLELSKNARYEVVESGKSSVRMRHMTPQGVLVERNMRFLPDQFLVEHDVVLKNQSQTQRTIALDVLMNTAEPVKEDTGWFSKAEDPTSFVWQGLENREVVAATDIEKNKNFAGSANYVGFDKRYFLMVLIPERATSVESTEVKLWESEIAGKVVKGALMTLHQEPAELTPGETLKLSYVSYLGPKQMGLLKSAGHNLDENINFGWFGVISRPLLWLLGEIYGLVGNFGWAIILLTLLLKIISFPLTQKSFVSMQQMKKIHPEIKALQDKYSHDRTLLSQKQMELYKEKGINPMAGCLPMLIQMPIWFALYQMLWNSVELYQQPFVLWLKDLTAADPYYILPVAMGVSMYIQQAFQPTMEDQPQMKYVMWGMPLFLTFIMLSLPAGLSLYIFVNNILTIFQQFYIKQRYGKIDAPAKVVQTT